ncbi:hypothetical protein SLEP1_g8063 [Rubroshorea leprosula]|uniref:Uncharacterized protein n=1 Tax=Rubroshorea leprosula TaxID=152421 RepID=A0AAV5I0E3_9ROSI|nr:hypothetical protein SLEP1_g8063 [Rubroshorea leprosula]
MNPARGSKQTQTIWAHREPRRTQIWVSEEPSTGFASSILLPSVFRHSLLPFLSFFPFSIPLPPYNNLNIRNTLFQLTAHCTHIIIENETTIKINQNNNKMLRRIWVCET